MPSYRVIRMQKLARLAKLHSKRPYSLTSLFLVSMQWRDLATQREACKAPPYIAWSPGYMKRRIKDEQR